MATTAMTAADLPRRFAKHLVPTERVVVGSRRHGIRVVEPIGSCVAAIVFVLWLEMQLPRDLEVLPQLLWLPPVVLFARAGWRFWEWTEDWFVVTDRRLMLGSGVVTRKIAMMPMRKVTDMSYNRTPMGQVLNYGEFVLESAGQDQALREIKWLPDADRLYRLICTEIFGPDGSFEDEDGIPLDAWTDDEPDVRDDGDGFTGWRLGTGGRESRRGDHQETDLIDRRDADLGTDLDHDLDTGDDADADDGWGEGFGEPLEEEPPRGLRRADPRRWARRRRRWRRDDRWDD